MIHKTIIIDNIIVNVSLKNIKNTYLKVKPPKGEVFISAPLHTRDSEIIRITKLKKEWILEKQKYIQENNNQPTYLDGEKCPLWGEKYVLQRSEDIKIDNKCKIIYLPKYNREKILTEIYRLELKNKLPQVFNKCRKIVGVNPTAINIRKMKNWGNCKNDGRITLNLYLAMKKPICLEYVLIHELCHLIEFNHSKNFKKLMDKFCPDWREIKKILNEKD